MSLTFPLTFFLAFFLTVLKELVIKSNHSIVLFVNEQKNYQFIILKLVSFKFWKYVVQKKTTKNFYCFRPYMPHGPTYFPLHTTEFPHNDGFICYKKLPTDLPVLGHSCSIVWNICLFIQLNIDIMDDLFIH